MDAWIAAAAAALVVVAITQACFVFPGSAVSPLPSLRVSGLGERDSRGHDNSEEQPSIGRTDALCFGLVAGVAAVSVVARRSVQAEIDKKAWRKSQYWRDQKIPGIDQKTLKELGAGTIAPLDPNQTKFANGLVGTEYGGFGRHEYDPLEFSARYTQHLPWYREAELKHGRVAMLAFVGLLAQDAFRLPVPQLQDESINILNAHSKLIGPNLGEGPMWWLLIFCSVIESKRFKDLGLGFEKLTLENAGDLDFGKGFLPKTEDGIVQMKVKELKNGRLAMLAFSGAITTAGWFNEPHFPWVPH